MSLLYKQVMILMCALDDEVETSRTFWVISLGFYCPPLHCVLSHRLWCALLHTYKSQEDAVNYFGIILSELDLSCSCTHRETEITADLKSNWYMIYELIHMLFLSRTFVLTSSLLVFHQGGEEAEYSLTAYVVASLLEAGHSAAVGVSCSVSPVSHLSNCTTHSPHISVLLQLGTQTLIVGQ